MRNVRGKTEDINSRRVVLNYIRRRGERAVAVKTEGVKVIGVEKRK